MCGPVCVRAGLLRDVTASPWVDTWIGFPNACSPVSFSLRRHLCPGLLPNILLFYTQLCKGHIGPSPRHPLFEVPFCHTTTCAPSAPPKLQTIHHQSSDMLPAMPNLLRSRRRYPNPFHAPSSGGLLSCLVSMPCRLSSLMAATADVKPALKSVATSCCVHTHAYNHKGT